MAAYFIGEHLVHDETAYRRYLDEVVPMIERHGGKYLTKIGGHFVLEGDWHPNRVVIVEFPDMASLRGWYDSAEYRPFIALRQAASRDVLMALDGR